MTDDPSDAVVTAWARLLRAQRAALGAVEAELKRAGLPPLAWYDVLLELKRAPDKRLTPGELEERLLLAQYNLSRLLDRMVADGLVRRLPYPGDKRRQWIEPTAEGRALRRRMWPVYAAAITRHVGARLGDRDAARLADLLAKLL
jgi:DNA-binding MarR family transcriptional regulator